MISLTLYIIECTLLESLWYFFADLACASCFKRPMSASLINAPSFVFVSARARRACGLELCEIAGFCNFSLEFYVKNLQNSG